MTEPVEQKPHPGGVSVRVQPFTAPDGSLGLMLIPAPHVQILLPLPLAEGVHKAMAQVLALLRQRAEADQVAGGIIGKALAQS